jgi:hypothetical protein
MVENCILLYKSLHLVILVLICFSLQSEAQQVISATGTTTTTSEGSVSYTLGEIAIQTTETSSGTSSEGVQQAYEIYKVGVTEITLGGFLNVYPNPTNGQLTLNTANFNKNLAYELYDSQGKLIQECASFSDGHTLSISEVVNAVYYLKISSDSQPIQTFKIMKN